MNMIDINSTKRYCLDGDETIRPWPMTVSVLCGDLIVLPTICMALIYDFLFMALSRLGFEILTTC